MLIGASTFSLHTSTGEMAAHAALQAVMEITERETLPQAAWELLVELVHNVYEHASADPSIDTQWGVEIVPDTDVVHLRIFDEGIGIASEKLPLLFAEKNSAHNFRGKGLLALKKYVRTGAVMDAEVSSDGATIRFNGKNSLLTGIRPPVPGVEVTALCRRGGFQ